MSSDKNLAGIKNSKKPEKNILVTVFKITITILVLILQFAIMYFLYSATKGISTYATAIFEIIKLITVIYLLQRNDSDAYKMSWILFIMFLPIVGILAYHFWGNSKLRFKVREELERIRENSNKYFEHDEQIKKEILDIDKRVYNEINYINKMTGYPICRNEGIEYLDIGENFFRTLITDLKEAKDFIFIEFYIISEGRLWQEIFPILKDKVKQGVEVNIIVDSLGSLLTKPKNFTKELEEANINLYYFNKFTPIINGYINYRDHRKIIVIDGIIAYTGGVNLADEYSNLIEKYGYWKDVGIKVRGKVVDNFTIMFLRNIEIISMKKVNYQMYLNKSDKNRTLKANLENIQHKGYVIGYCDGPDNRKNPVETVYVKTISNAKDYIYMTTPYFIVSETVINAILNSARSGVDARIIVPYIPDKVAVNIVTKSYYEALLSAGVKVYEYKPGFIHSKSFVSDDEISIVGTANLDFRSMNLNYECVLFSYLTGEELKIKEDFNNMLKECKEIKLEEWQNRSIFHKMLEAILKTFSPML